MLQMFLFHNITMMDQHNIWYCYDIFISFEMLCKSMCVLFRIQLDVSLTLIRYTLDNSFLAITGCNIT
jgi:hypothetical protein